VPTPTSGAGVPTGHLLSSLGLVRQLAEIIASTEAFAVDSAGGLLYRYSDGVYKPDGERHVKQAVKALLVASGESRRWSRYLSDEVLAYIAVDAPELWTEVPRNQINVLNGLLDLQSHTLLLPHTPTYLSTVQLPVFYDPSADCPAWCTFLKRVLPPDVYEAGLVWQLLAQILAGDIDSHQAILLSGPGGNGKSTLCQAMRAFLGENNVSSLNLNQLSNQFGADNLYGRLANVIDDLSSRHLVDTSTFKRIVGGDIITADRKYRDPLVFRPFARLVFSANELPQVSDASDGFYDRWVVLPFPNDFRGQYSEIPRHILDAQLAASAELSGVLNRALKALPNIVGKRLPMSVTMRQAWNLFRNSTDWVLIWLERMLVEQPTGVIEKKAIHQALILEAQRQRRAVISPTALYRQIRKHWPHVIESQRRIDPARDGVPCFVGLSWRQGVPPV
jgi:putative DNA primase/helicase